MAARIVRIIIRNITSTAIRREVSVRALNKLISVILVSKESDNEKSYEKLLISDVSMNLALICFTGPRKNPVPTSEVIVPNE